MSREDKITNVFVHLCVCPRVVLFYTFIHYPEYLRLCFKYVDVHWHAKTTFSLGTFLVHETCTACCFIPGCHVVLNLIQ